MAEISNQSVYNQQKELASKGFHIQNLHPDTPMVADFHEAARPPDSHKPARICCGAGFCPFYILPPYRLCCCFSVFVFLGLQFLLLYIASIRYPLPATRAGLAPAATVRIIGALRPEARLRYAMPSSNRIPLVEQIDALLPQTQCGKCKTPGCRPYAEAMAAGAPLNRCVPGGADTIADLANLLHRPILPLDPEYGVEPAARHVAYIREAECIGCTKCLQACPVDAILGAARLMHTVLADECTGCDLCMAPCPVDCIETRDLPKIIDRAQKRAMAAHNRQRFEAREARLARDKAASASAIPTPPAARPASHTAYTTVSAPMASASATRLTSKSLVIAAALARVNLKKAQLQLVAAETASDDNRPALAALRAEVQRLQAEVDALECGSE
jgi:electron transport complex protein RnfB